MTQIPCTTGIKRRWDYKDTGISGRVGDGMDYQPGHVLAMETREKEDCPI